MATRNSLGERRTADCRLAPSQTKIIRGSNRRQQSCRGLRRIMSNPSPPREGGAEGDTPFALQYFPPEADLADLVSTFYFVRIDRPPFDEYERADRPQFRLMTHPNGEYVFPDGHRFAATRSEEHTSELQSLMRISYAVFCLNKKK